MLVGGGGGDSFGAFMEYGPLYCSSLLPMQTSTRGQPHAPVKIVPSFLNIFLLFFKLNGFVFFVQMHPSIYKIFMFNLLYFLNFLGVIFIASVFINFIGIRYTFVISAIFFTKYIDLVKEKVKKT